MLVLGCENGQCERADKKSSVKCWWPRTERFLVFIPISVFPTARTATRSNAFRGRIVLSEWRRSPGLRWRSTLDKTQLRPGPWGNPLKTPWSNMLWESGTFLVMMLRNICSRSRISVDRHGFGLRHKTTELASPRNRSSMGSGPRIATNERRFEALRENVPGVPRARSAQCVLLQSPPASGRFECCKM